MYEPKLNPVALEAMRKLKEAIERAEAENEAADQTNTHDEEIAEQRKRQS